MSITDKWSIYRNKDIIIWGCGFMSPGILEELKNNNLNVKAFCDNNYTIFDEKYFNIPVFSPDILKCMTEKEKDNILIQISVLGDIRIDIEKQASDLGFKLILHAEPLFPACKYERNYEFYKKLPIDQYEKELKIWYEVITKKTLNLKNPVTFNEKIQWLKLYDSTPLKSQLADKYLVRDWVKNQIGEEYLIPLIGVWDSFDEIDFDSLPNRFALKANHGCEWNYIVEDKSKFDIKKAKEDFDKWLNIDYSYKAGFELHYSAIKPKIIAEEYIQEINGLSDYKFYCVNGELLFICIVTDIDTDDKKRTFLDENFNILDMSLPPTLIDRNIVRPKNLDKMLTFAKKLSLGFILVRVDLYSINNKLYFGEMTFTPNSGICDFDPMEKNKEYGDKIILPI